MSIEKMTNRIKSQVASMSILIFSLAMIFTFLISNNIYLK